MKIRADESDGRTMQRYLLGDLPDSARAQVEKRFFHNNNYFIRLCELEVDLIHRYVRGCLPAHQSRLFEARFLPSRRSRSAVAFARALLACAESGNLTR